VKQEVGSLGIHPQAIVLVQLMDIFIAAFAQDRDPVGRTLQDKPFFGTGGNGEGIILVPGTPEGNPITKITLSRRLVGNRQHLQLDREIVEAALLGFEDCRFVVRTGDFDMIILGFMIANEVIVEFAIGPIGGGVGKVVLVEQGGAFPSRVRHVELADDEIVEVDVGVGAVEGFDIKADLATGIIRITELTDDFIIDMKDEIGTLGIHAQGIILIQLVQVAIGAFGQDGQGTGGILEHKPFLGARRNGEGIILVAGASEGNPITKITLRRGFGRHGEYVQVNGDILETLFLRFEDRGFGIGTGDFDVVILGFMIADEIIIELVFRPAGGRVGEIIME